MNFKNFLNALVLSIVLILNCSQNNAISKSVIDEKINKDSFQKFGKFSFIISFSNLIYQENEQEIKIPIFQGNKGDVYYNDLLNYFHNNNLLDKDYRESGFVISTKRGELKKTFHEFLKFYKGNILKDVNIDKPAKMIISDGVLEIYYDFKVKGVPVVLQITIYTVEEYFNTKSLRSVFDVNVDENMKTQIPYFNYLFTINQSSEEL